MSGNNLTFIIPIRIDSYHRERNADISIRYLRKIFPDSRIIVKENDSTSKLPGTLKTIVDYIFEYSEDKIFHRTRILNEMLHLSESVITVNYDVDVILPISSYIESERLIIEDDYDVIYPFRPEGSILKTHIDDFAINRNWDFIAQHLVEWGIPRTLPWIYPYPGNQIWGYVQFFKTESYRKGFMENENFVSWGPEDGERYYRFETLGFKIGRIEDFAYHIEHTRDYNGNPENPHYKNNNDLYEKLKTFNRDQLIDYYQQQVYLEKYCQKIYNL